MKPHFVMIMGLPGSGKTTHAKTYGEYFHCEADDWFTNQETGVYTFEPSQLKNAHKYCQMAFQRAIESGINVVVSNTFTRQWERKFYLDMAFKTGYRITVVDCKDQYENVHGVPFEKLPEMAKRFEELSNEDVSKYEIQHIILQNKKFIIKL